MLPAAGSAARTGKNCLLAANQTMDAAPSVSRLPGCTCVLWLEAQLQPRVQHGAMPELLLAPVSA
jgi:hypothetical protein